MRTRFIFGIVMLLAFFISPELMGKNPSSSGEGSVGISVRQEVDSEIFNLGKNIKAAKGRAKAFKALEKTETQVSAIRSKAPRQIEPDEIYMNMLKATLKEIPRGKSFKPADCEKYRSEILAQYDPQGEEHPTSLAVEKTLDVLNGLCALSK